MRPNVGFRRQVTESFLLAIMLVAGASIEGCSVPYLWIAPSRPVSAVYLERDKEETYLKTACSGGRFARVQVNSTDASRTYWSAVSIDPSGEPTVPIMVAKSETFKIEGGPVPFSSPWQVFYVLARGEGQEVIQLMDGLRDGQVAWSNSVGTKDDFDRVLASGYFSCPRT